MHSIFKALSLIGLSMVVFACSDWTDAEALQMTQYSNTEIAKKETYYQAESGKRPSIRFRSVGLEVGVIPALLLQTCWQDYPIQWMLCHSGTILPI